MVGADMKVEVVVDVVVNVNVVEMESVEMQMVVDMSNELDVMGEMTVEVVLDEVWLEVEWMSSPHLHKADGVK